jgi:hypothetical protein
VITTTGGRSAAIVPISGIVTWKSERNSSRNASNSSSARSSSSMSSTQPGLRPPRATAFEPGSARSGRLGALGAQMKELTLVVPVVQGVMDVDPS